MQFQQEIEGKEGHLEQAYSRLEAGEAPDDEIAKEWIRILQKKAQKSMVIIKLQCIIIYYERHFFNRN